MPTSSRRSLLAALLMAFGFSVAPRAAAAGGAATESRDCPTKDCGWVYDPAIGDPEHGIAPGTAFDDLPDDWACPNCGRVKDRW